MRTTTTLLAVAVAASASHPSHAQWGTDIVNNAINWELNIGEGEYSGPNDANDSADATIRTTLLVNGTNLGDYCTTWDCASPCTSGSSPGFWSGEGDGYTSGMFLYGETFESDGVNDCVYDANYDDHHWEGPYTLRDGPGYMLIVYPSPDFRPCQWNQWLGNGSSWLLPETAEFDQRMYLTWRYSAGWGPSAPLDFGTVAMNTTKRDVNSNVPLVGQASSVGLQYADVIGSLAPDVYYKFHIDQASTVTISTDDALTNFDTDLYLYSLPSGQIIANDDDGGVVDGTSTIVMQLCAGDYQVHVTGFSILTGLFRLIVAAQAGVCNQVGVEEHAPDQTISCFPNPSTGLFRIDLSGASLSAETRLTLVDALGRTVHASIVTRELLDMDLSHLPEGAYLLHVNDPKWRSNKRIMIQQ